MKEQENINPLWESHGKTDAQVVESYEAIIDPLDNNFVTVEDIGKPQLNSKLAKYHHIDNFNIRKEDLMLEGMDEITADKDAKEYADELYANTLMALDGLYSARNTA